MLSSIFGLIAGLIKLGLVGLVVVGIIAFFGYNKLRSLAESIKEAWSNIGVVGRKQASLVNQLIDVVKGYQESEKLVMLKVSEDMSNAANVAQMYQQSGMVLSSVNGLAERFPELKANQHYQRLIDSIQACESQLEDARARYNSHVRGYNTARSSIPTVFYAPVLGFKAAPYLEFEGNSQTTDMGTLKSFTADDDGERLNAMLGKAGGKLLEASNRGLVTGRAVAQKALEGGRVLADRAQERIETIRDERNGTNGAAAPGTRICEQCGAEGSATGAFCPGCGARAGV